ncbi:MAG: type II secretion system protein, partial [Phycisphaerales bacterium]
MRMVSAPRGHHCAGDGAWNGSARGARGFTLLEVVLAVGMLGGIALMVSLMWGTLVRWQGDVTRQRESMGLERVVELLREQWA